MIKPKASPQTRDQRADKIEALRARAVVLVAALALAVPIAYTATTTQPTERSACTMSSLPRPTENLGGVLRDFRGRLARLESRSPFYGTDLHPDGAGGMTLSDVPLQPSISQVAQIDASAFALTTSWAELATLDVTVPTGCTRLAATAYARLYARNQNTTAGSDGAGTDAIYVSATIGGTASITTPTGISGSGGYATTFGALAVLLEDLTPGDPVTLTLRGTTGFQNFAAHADNFAHVVYALTWLR